MGGAAFANRGSSAPRPANGGEASPVRRLDALHRKSGEITHDLNNLLGVILSGNERLAEELPEGSDQQKLALLALEAAERAAELLRRSLALTQGQTPAPQPDTADGAQA